LVNNFKLALTIVLLNVCKDEIDHAGMQTIPSDSNMLTKKFLRTLSRHWFTTILYGLPRIRAFSGPFKRK